MFLPSLQPMQRFCHFCEARNCVTEPIHHSKKPLDLLEVLGHTEVTDALELLWIRSDAFTTADETKELKLFLEKFAFAWFEDDVMLPHPFKDLLQVIQMFFKRLAEATNVVNVDETKLVLDAGQRVVHESLERCRSVAQSKWHAKPLEQAML